jgi:Phosphotransferase enzyme family
LQAAEWYKGKNRHLFELALNQGRSLWRVVMKMDKEGKLGFELSPKLASIIEKSWANSSWDKLQVHLQNPEIPWTLCHGDFHAGNMILDGDELFMVDWSQCTSFFLSLSVFLFLFLSFFLFSFFLFPFVFSPVSFLFPFPSFRIFRLFLHFPSFSFLFLPVPAFSWLFLPFPFLSFPFLSFSFLSSFFSFFPFLPFPFLSFPSFLPSRSLPFLLTFYLSRWTLGTDN